MDFELSPTEREFRDDVRAWLKANKPGDGESRAEGQRAFIESRRAWQKKLHEAGYVGITWPQEYGGRGAGFMEQLIFNDEMIQAQAPEPINVIGLGMGGPVVIAHGTEDQKKRYLAPLLSGEEIWCQGFSEPNAGSDLSGLQTRAEDKGDHYVVNGQKVWTTLAHVAKWCMLLTRERREANPRDGLTYLLVDMESPGVEVRPLVQITGDAEFNEIFFKDVVVPKSQILGEAGSGWAVAMTTLLHERGTLGMALATRAQITAAELAEHARKLGRGSDPLVRQRIAQHTIQARALPQRHPGTGGLDPQAHVVRAQPAHGRDRGRHRGSRRTGGRRRGLGIPVPALAREHHRGGHLRGAAEHPGRARARPPAQPLERTTWTSPSPRSRRCCAARRVTSSPSSARRSSCAS